MDLSANNALRTPAPAAVTPADPPPTEPKSAAKAGDFFWNLLDVINPLQHIPVISTIYRAITGDEITPAAKLAGGALFGGPIGALAAIAGIAVEETTGRDVGEYLASVITGNDNAAPPPGQALQQAQLNLAPPAQTQQTQSQPPRDTIVWNGVRQLPALQTSAQPAPDLTDQSALAPEPARPDTTPAPGQLLQQAQLNPPPRDTIIWNGVRQLPIPQSSAPPPALTDQSAVVPEQAPPVLASTTPSAAWLTTALAQAQTIETANADGDTPPRPQGEPWIADAMMQALDQYDALAKQRRSDANP